MSFLNKFRNTSNKSKNSKQGWEPPKIVPSDDTTNIIAQNDSKNSESNFSFLSEESKEAEENFTSVERSPLTATTGTDSKTFPLNAEAGSGDQSSDQSSFSFISDSCTEKIYHDSDTAQTAEKLQFFSENSAPVATKPFVKKKLDITPRKKKKKAVQPGYGKEPEKIANETLRESRSSSTASSSEAKTEVTIDDDMNEIENDFKESREMDGQHMNDSDFDRRRESLSSYESSSAFDFMSDGMNDDSEQKEYDVEVDAARRVSNDVDEGVSRDRLVHEEQYRDKEVDLDDEERVKGSRMDGEGLETKSAVEMERSLNEDSRVLSEACNADVQEACSEDNEKRMVKTADLINENHNLKDDKVNNHLESTTTINDLKDVLGECSSASPSYEVKLDEEERTTLYLETLDSREKSIREQLANMKKMYDDILSDFKGNTFSKYNLVTQIKELQEEQNAALNKEDISMAEKINQKLEQKQWQLRNLKYKHPIVEEKVSVLVQESNEVIEQGLKECNCLRSGCREIILLETSSLKERTSKKDGDLYKAKLKLEGERSKLDRDMDHFELDREHLVKRKVKLDKEMFEMTKNEEEEKDRLTSERDDVRNEVKNLEERLCSLRRNEDTLSTKIEEVDQSIRNMTQDFWPQRETLEREEAELDERKEDMNAKLKLIEKSEEDLKEKEENEKIFEKRCNENIRALNMKVETLKKLQEEMDENLINMRDVVDLDLLCYSPSQEYRNAREELDKLSDELCLSKYKKIDHDTKITRLKKKLDDIEARVEELEKEKQVAVSGRNFKAAKVIIEERNEMMCDGQQTQKELANLEDKRMTLDTTIQTLNSEISLMERKVMKIEEELDEKILSCLVKAVNSMRDFLKRSNSKSWIRQFLEFEMQICKDIVEDICSKYDWPKPDILSPEDVITHDDSCKEELSFSDKRISEDHPENTEERDEGAAEGDDVSEVLNAQIEDLERQLLEAVENENFDHADEINNRIEECKRQLKQQDVLAS